jgi:hypothetical protein
MPHFVLTRAGGWATLYVPTAADFNDLDTKTFKALNGDEGGSWSPSAAIVVGGSGMQLPDGSTWFAYGTLQVDGTPAVPLVHPAWHGRILLTGTNAKLDVQSAATSTWDTSTTLNLNGTVAYGTTAVVTFGNGATVDYGNGATCTHDSGSNLVVALGCATTFAGAVTFDPATASLSIPGAHITLHDNLAPQFLTPQTRVIAQPVVVNGTTALVGGDRVVDVVNNTDGFTWQMTKLANGSTVTQIAVNWNSVSTTPGANPAVVSLHRTRYDGVTVTLGSVNVNPSVVASGTSLITGLSEVIDDSLYTYWLHYVAESGTGAQSLGWFPPLVTCTHITGAQSI